MNQERYEGSTAARKLLLIFGVSCLAIGCKADTPRSRLTARERKEKDEALYSAVSDHDLGRVRKLVDEGADVNAIAYDSLRILHIACGHRDASIAKFLIARGADVRAKDDSGQTALYYAVFHPDVVELLIAKGADVNARDCGYTPLYWAAKFGCKRSVEVLISKGASARLKDPVGATPLHVAAKEKQLEVLMVLLNDGKTTGSAVADWVVVGALKRAKRLLSADPKLVKATDSYKWSPLHWAAAAGKTKGVKLLLDHGAEIDAPDAEGDRPLELAVRRGELSMVKLLLSRGADVKSRKDDSFTGLVRATHAGRTEIVRLLLESGADPDTPAFDIGVTSLHMASRYGHRELVSLLIAKGADVNAKDHYDQSTPLHMAAWRDRPEIAALLLANGADPNAKNREGATPLDVAEERRSPEVAKVLRKHGK